MGATRTIWRAAVPAVCLSLLSACHPNGKRPRREPKAAAVTGLSSAIAAEGAAEKPRPVPSQAPLPKMVVQTLRTLREQRLEIVPPTTPNSLLSFGTGRLLQASLDKATFRDSKLGEVITEASIGPVREVAHGVDGSLFAIGASAGVRLEPRAKAVKRFAHVPFLPGSQLLPDLEQPDHFFVYYPEAPQLYWYAFQSAAGAILPIADSFRLDGCREPLTQLRDGAIVCASERGFLRQAPRGSRAEFAFPANGERWVRLLPGQRLDEFFAVSRQAVVIHLRLASGLTELGRFRLPAPAYAAAANTEALAFVLVDDPQVGKGRRWSLLVTDFDGQTRFESDLPGAAPSAEEDWLAALVEDKNLAISGFDALVAVGGARNVTVWNYAQRRELFRR